MKMRKKDQIHIESKVKTVRFIGEMTKFGMITYGDALNCLKVTNIASGEVWRVT